MKPIGSIEWHGVIARLHGEIDRTNADVLQQEIADHGPCVVDLEHVGFIDIAGVRALYELYRNHGCLVVNMSPAVTRIANVLDLRFLIGPPERNGAASPPTV
jgi:anti-anti-sigma factor